MSDERSDAIIRDERTWRNVTEVADLPLLADEEAFLDRIADCVDGWFGERKTIPTEDFLDRFIRANQGDGYGPDDWDLDRYDSPVAKAILAAARKYRRENPVD